MQLAKLANDRSVFGVDGDSHVHQKFAESAADFCSSNNWPPVQWLFYLVDCIMLAVSTAVNIKHVHLTVCLSVCLSVPPYQPRYSDSPWGSTRCN